jgi:hypothetical protein
VKIMAMDDPSEEPVKAATTDDPIEEPTVAPVVEGSTETEEPTKAAVVDDANEVLAKDTVADEPSEEAPVKDEL